MTEIRAIENSLRLEIKVNAYNWSEILGYGEKRFREKWSKEAFKKALDKGNTIELLIGHNAKNGTIGSVINTEARNDGFYALVELNHDYAYLYPKAEKGQLSVSFGFRALSDEWKRSGNYYERRIFDAEIFEISILDGQRPAFKGTRVETRDKEGYEIRYLEDFNPRNNIDLKQKQLDLLKLM